MDMSIHKKLRCLYTVITGSAYQVIYTLYRKGKVLKQVDQILTVRTNNKDSSNK